MFGASHFFNGVLARRVPAMNIAVCSQTGGAVLFLLWTLATWGTSPSGPDLIWAVISGIGAGIGVGALYEGMRQCRISVVVPVTSIVSVAVPFLISVSLLGEQVDTFLLAAAALLVPATWLLSRPISSSSPARTDTSQAKSAAPNPEAQRRNSTAVVFGLIAGAGYATQLFALSRITTPEPAAPMLIGQLASIGVLLVVLRTRTGRLNPTGQPTTLGRAGLVGGLAALAMISYLYATREAALTLVMIAIALYPALPVLLALLVLKERLSTPQTIGLSIAALVLPLLNLTG